VVARWQSEPVLRIGRAVGKEAEIFRAAERGLAHEAKRLAGVEGFHDRNLVRSLFNRVGYRMQDLPTLFAACA